MRTPWIQKRLRHVGLRTGLLKQEAGTALVELSIALSFSLIIIFSAMELCSAVYTYTVLADAANEGVHFAIINSSDEIGAVNKVKSYAGNSLHDLSKINVSVTYPDGTAAPPNRVAVSVSYQYVPYLSNFMTNPPAMHAFAEGRMMH